MEPVDQREQRTAVGIRYLPSGDEAGSAPDDRRFRPDVAGLRAVAVLLVVLYHAGVPELTGGYVGVDVFFVISGFVITGLLLRERQESGRNSLLHFYARRVRRILPAATLVVLAAAAMSYVWLGFVTGNQVADDGRWAAAFLVNFHFTATGTNYLTAQLPPSPLQNFWSLSVEEQFYVVFPTLVIVVGAVARRVPFRVKLGVTLSAVVVASYAWSIVQTSSQPTAAYFSPFTRAWELALGALVALGSTWLKQVPTGAAAVATWAGLGAVLVAAFSFGAHTAYPGSLVAVPVVGTALAIAGGTAVPRLGAERLVGLAPFDWLGKRSYSWYLWHWPILIVATEYLGKTSLPAWETLGLVTVALGIAAVTYAVLENPVRHAPIPRVTSIGLGAALVVVTLLLLTVAIGAESSGGVPHYVVHPGNAATVRQQVEAAPRLRALPAALDPPVAAAGDDWGATEYAGCMPQIGTASEPADETRCIRGDPTGLREMVVYGDSHALMWLPAFNTIARKAHYRLVILGKPDCPDDMLTYVDPPGFGVPGARYTACAQWHRWALAWIAQHRPNLLVVTQQPQAMNFTTAEWRVGFTRLLDTLAADRVNTVVLGNIPILPDSGPVCLAQHTDDVQACSRSRVSPWTPFSKVERSVARKMGVRYIDPTPWFCSWTCTAVIGHYVVYVDHTHVTGVYAQYLSTVLGQALAPSMPPA